MIKIAVTRLKTLSAGLLDCQKRVARRVERGLRSVGEDVYQESMKLVPIDTSSLRESGRVRQVDTGFATVVYVGYGQENVVYKGRYSWSSHRLVNRTPYEYAYFVHQGAGPHPSPLSHFLSKAVLGHETTLSAAFWVGAGR